MKYTTKEYDKIIDILNRNPLLPITQISSVLKKGSPSDLSKMFADIRKSYINDETVSRFLKNNISRLDPILFINGILKSLCRELLDQSSSMASVFDEIAKYYKDIEDKQIIPESIKYSNLYAYFSALMRNEDLPQVTPEESGILLSLIYEISNFEKVATTSEKDFVVEFYEKIQNQVAEFLLKTTVKSEDWTKLNEDKFLQSFKLPTATDIESDTEFKQIQKEVAMFSLNPFNVDPEHMESYKSMVTDILSGDISSSRDIKTICQTVGATLDNDPLVVGDDQQDIVIINRKRLRSDTSSSDDEDGLCDPKRKQMKMIDRHISKHEIIDLKAMRQSTISNDDGDDPDAQV